MKILTLNLLDILHKSQALYSTEFSGEYQPPADLLELLLENSDTQEAYVDGLMFLKKIENGSYLVVDGIKRLISLSLLLHAICECYKMSNDTNTHAIELIKNRYLFNKFGTKIQLNGYEKQIYEKLVKYERMTDEEKNHPMFTALHEFWAKIKLNNLSATKLFNQIKNIKVMVCIYNECPVDNRDLYQFLNCNNPNLEELLLITNFVEEKAKTDAKYWYEIIDLYKNSNVMNFFKFFMRDFLTIQKNGIIPRQNELYMSFKRYYNRINLHQKPKEIFKNIEKFARYYIKIIQADFENFEIKKCLTTINENEMQETYPYLLEVTDDFMNKRITEETFVELLNTVILFIADKQTHDISSSFNFANLSHEINRKISK